MSTDKFIFFLHYLTIMIAFIVITYAAITFQKVGILWWYILPFFMSYVKITINENNKSGGAGGNV